MERNQTIGTKTGGAFGKFLHFPLIRMFVGSVLCGVVALGLNALLRIFFEAVGLNANLARVVRSLVFLVALLLTYSWLYKNYEKRPVTELSLKHLPMDALWECLAGVLCLSITLAVCSFLGAYQILSSGFSILLVLAGSIVILAAAAFEEVVFRGIIFRITEEWLGTNLALILSALFFGMSHLLNDQVSVLGLLSATLGGLIVAMTFVLTKRLWVTIVFHATWNYTQVFFGLTLSGLSDFADLAIFKSQLQGPDWLTGGRVGIEASVVTLVLLTLIIVWLYVRSMKMGQILKPFWKN